MENRKKVVVGMSGGVDSSVAAYLLLQQGYDVVGVTMQIWQDESAEAVSREGGCCGLSAVDDARRVASSLGIPYYVMNFKREFDEKVIQYFIEAYKRGETPNPCIACNRYVKWESLLERSLEIGADYIATGHYAQIRQLENGRYTIMNSVTAAKDQTYALYNLTQEQLARTLMPVGAYHKEEIRQMAKSIDVRVSNKRDSQEICFIPDNDYTGFLEENSEGMPGPGPFVSPDGEVLGMHKGIHHYTIGQRKGLGLALGFPAFVSAIRPDTNEVVIGTNEDVYGNELSCSQLNWMAVEALPEPARALVKIRYSHRGSMATLYPTDHGQVRVVFDEPVRAITPGQVVVFYQDNYILGGGTILPPAL